jgi:hypothetical protein
MKKQTLDSTYPLRKKYWKLHVNFYGLIKHNLLTDTEKKTMETELSKARKDWEEAEEQKLSR